MKPSIAIINKSKRVSNADAKLMMRACQLQLRRDVAPIFERKAWTLSLHTSRKTLPKRGCIAIVMFDEPDDPGLYGYHDEDEHGRRYGRVFINPTLDDGGTVLGVGDSVSATLSHEVIEAFTDPACNIWTEGPRELLWAYEVCDPVESSSYRIKVGKRFVGVSNFVFDTWFDPKTPRHIKTDHMGVTEKPFQLAPGGSAVTWNRKEVKLKTRGLARSRKARKDHHLARTHRRMKQK